MTKTIFKGQLNLNIMTSKQFCTLVLNHIMQYLNIWTALNSSDREMQLSCEQWHWIVWPYSDTNIESLLVHCGTCELSALICCGRALIDCNCLVTCTTYAILSFLWNSRIKCWQHSFSQLDCCCDNRLIAVTSQHLLIAVLPITRVLPCYNILC
jgi:hypothetical protein